ncbi:WhiB family transcriptional regulator [Streptomyces bambusae]|uniref:WhiB family transcriptional regulator n=1 Tax=Streptomyces bambusae TaxID=1550616 RepID=UPI001CFE1C88|nr:WhiB family transcriptional regulator [Streptomyces bambusae]MCB5168042.1 WhiB family transcriptional regulator [Streptomyces bambusae]
MSAVIGRAMPVLPAAGEWQQHATCSRQPTLFDSEEPKDVAAAKAHCRRCPVQDICLRSALAEERNDSQWARFGVRGGLDPVQRAQLAGVTPATDTLENPDTLRAADELLHAGELSDAAIGRQLGVRKQTIRDRRITLGIPPLAERVAAARTVRRLLSEYAVPAEDGHVLWNRPGFRPEIDGRQYSGPQLAFVAEHGRAPEGKVQAVCGRAGCIAGGHLTDRSLREARVAA